MTLSPVFAIHSPDCCDGRGKVSLCEKQGKSPEGEAVRDDSFL